MVREQVDEWSADVCIAGLGYAGLTLAVALAEVGVRVLGYEVNRQACAMLNRGQPHFFEQGLAEAVQRHIGGNLRVTPELPPALPPAAIIAVGTPIHEDHTPDLHQLDMAVNAIAERLTPETLVVLRSTLPVGTCRSFVLPRLQRRVPAPLLAFCPERTIQGIALQELRSLPQIVGGLTVDAAERATAFFRALTPQVITVSSIEAAEMVKLICNAHTDLIYGFGNEVALCAEALGIDAHEVISAANTGYPRPDLSRPGFVGGGCLSKDPYLLIASVQRCGYSPALVAAARALNESMPRHVGARVALELQALGRAPEQAKVLISGFAYKGQPETDDLRGAPAQPFIESLGGRIGQLMGHDFVVPPDHIAALGVTPVGLEEGFADADAVVLLNNHRCYQTQDIHTLTARMRHPALLFDSWGVYQKQFAAGIPSVKYVRLGRG